MKKVAVVGVLAIVLGMVMISVFSSSSNYIDTVSQEREELLAFMQRNFDSPFDAKNPPQQLYFYEVDEKYRVEIKVVLLDGDDYVQIQQTSGKSPKMYKKVARLEFVLHKKACVLFLYQNEENPSDLLLPFGDETNGKSTYDTGRYLHVKPRVLQEKKYLLDFNMATNPYCAYNDEYICPIPPRENVLGIAIPAGEKKYHR